MSDKHIEASITLEILLAMWIPFKSVLHSVTDHDVVEKFSFLHGGDAAMDVAASKFMVAQGLDNLMRQQALIYITFLSNGSITQRH